MRMEQTSSLTQILFFMNSVYTTYLTTYKNLFETSQSLDFRKSVTTTVLTENGKYISSKLKEMINKDVYNCFNMRIVVMGINVDISIFKLENYPQTKIIMILKIIQYLIFLFKTINKTYKDNITIKVVLSPFKKHIEPPQQLSAFNVNSGFTVRDYSGRYANIVIFREEEVMKVLIHELLHAFDLDCKTIIDEDVKFIELFRKQTKININESFTESFACIINVCLASIIRLHNLKKQRTTLSLLKIFNELLEKEQKHILTIGEKVGRYNRNTIREETHITSYYVLKAINWIDIEDFASYILLNGYTIGTCRDYAVYLGKKLDKYSDKIKTLKFKDNQLQMIATRTVTDKNINSIRMSSIDILDI